MLKTLLKKQMAEIFRNYFYDPKKNKMRSKGATIAYIALYALLMVGLLGGMFALMAVGLCGPLVEAGMDWLYYLLIGADRGAARHVRQCVQHVFEPVSVQRQRPAAVDADPGALRDGLAPAGRVSAGLDVRRGRHRAGCDRLLDHGAGHGGGDRRPVC